MRDAGLVRKINTPVGVAKYIYLDTPDYEFNKNGDFKMKLFLDPQQIPVQNLMEELDGLLEEAVMYFSDNAKNDRERKKVRASENTPYYYEEDEDGKETGKIYMNPKSIASGMTREGQKWERHIPVFDAEGKRVTGALGAGSGTTLKVALEVRPYFNVQSGVGLSMRMIGVQIANLVRFGGGIQTAEDAGFDVIEGDFSADTFESPATPAAAPPVMEDDDADGDSRDGDY